MSCHGTGVTGACAMAFPGQGTQRPGAGAPFVNDAAWDVVMEINEVVAGDVPRLLLHADATVLRRTPAAQLSVFAVGLLHHHSIRRRVGTPTCVVGHSVGEITALVASGGLDVPDGARLVEARGEAMSDACAAAQGGMTAVRATLADTRSLIDGVADAWVAAINAPGDTVVGGTTAAMETVAERAGRRRVATTRLDVDGAFHTPLMAAAVAPFRQALADVEFRRASVPVASTVDGQTHVEAHGWESRLLRQLTTPVHWSQAVTSVAAAGTRCLVDAGSGGRLARLARKVSAGLETEDGTERVDVASGRGAVGHD